MEQRIVTPSNTKMCISSSTHILYTTCKRKLHIDRRLHMNVTLAMPPALAREVRDFAQAHNTTLNQFIRASLEARMAEERTKKENEIQSLFDSLEPFQGCLPKEYRFNREDANAR